MTQIVRVYGHSDDLVEFDGAVREEFGAYKVDWQGTLEAENGDGLVITASYAHNGTWAIGVGLLDEDIPLPAWGISLVTSNENAYSVELVLEIPDSAGVLKVTQLRGQ